MLNYGKAQGLLNPRIPSQADISNLADALAKDEANESWTRDLLANYPNRQILVFGNPVYGFIILQTIIDEAEIIMFWVDEIYRDQGIGTKALQGILQHMQSNCFKNIFLEVAIDNFAAIKVYESTGFVKTGIRKNYYTRANGDAIDAIIMAASI